MNVSFRYKISKNNLVRKKRFNCLDSNRTVKQMEENGMGREGNVAVFKDTEKQVKINSMLKSAVANSSANQELILEADKIIVSDKNRYKNTAEVIVSKKGLWKLHQDIKAQISAYIILPAQQILAAV